MLEEAPQRDFDLWPETVACWTALRDSPHGKLASDLVIEVYLRAIEGQISATDAWREQVAAMHGLLRHLQRIGLSRTAVTDDAIESLSQIESLRLINLQNTNVSEAAIEQLKKSLPKCEIKY